MSTSSRCLAGLLLAAAVATGCAGGSAKSATKARVTLPTLVAPPTTKPGHASSTSTTSSDTAGNVYAHTVAGDFSPAVKDVPARVYVPNSESNTVDVIDPATFTIIDHFPVGRLPQHVAPSWDLKTLYVDNDMGNSLTPIDPRTGKPGPAIPVEDPYNLYFTPDGSKAIVVAERLRRLDFRDPHSWQLVKSVPMPAACRGVDHLDFTADGSALLASCEYSGDMVRVDPVGMAVTGELHVGGLPIDVKLSPDGSVFYVANQQRNGVSLIDINALKEVGFIPTGAGAHGIYVSRDTKSLYVANRLGGSVSVIDLSTRKLAATWVVGSTPDMGGVSADGTQLWLSGRYSSDVIVIDTRTGKKIADIRVGQGPHGLDFFPQPGRYSLGHTGVYR